MSDDESSKNHTLIEESTIEQNVNTDASDEGDAASPLAESSSVGTLIEESAVDEDKVDPESELLPSVSSEQSGGLTSDTLVDADSSARHSSTASRSRGPQQDDNGFLYGEVPQPEAERMTEALASNELLALMLPPDQVTAFAREPESWDAYQTRFSRLDTYVTRMENSAQGARSQAAGQVLQHEQWAILREASRSEETYRERIVEELCQGILEQCRAEVRERVVEHLEEDTKNDKFLSLDEQRDVSRFGRRIGLEPDEIEQIQQDTADRHNADIGEPEAWVKRDPPEPAPPLRRIPDIFQVAEDYPQYVVDDLEQGLHSGTMRFWFEDEQGRKVYEAYETARQQVDNARDEERELHRGAWRIMWRAGVPWLDLNWSDGGSNQGDWKRVSTYRELSERVEQEGVEAILGVMSQGLLSLWMQLQAEAPDEVLEAVERAERTLQDRGASSRRASHALLDVQRVAWSMGYPYLHFDSHHLQSSDDYIELGDKVRDDNLSEEIELVGPWVEEALGRIEDLERVEDVRRDLSRIFSTGDEEMLLALAHQWALGRQDLQYDAFSCKYPSADPIAEEARHRHVAHSALGRTVADGSLAVWLALRGDGTYDDVLDALESLQHRHHSSLSAVQYHKRATAAIAELGHGDLVVFDRSESPLRFEDISTLVDEIHEHWSLFERDDEAFELLGVYLLRVPPNAFRSQTEPEYASRGAWSRVHELLADAGDTTLRARDGEPIGLDRGVRFGGWKPLDPSTSPERVIDNVVEWLNQEADDPRPLRKAFESDVLEAWLDWHLTSRAADMRDRVSGVSGDEAEFQAALWSLGYAKLVVNDRTTVGTVDQLINVARDNLEDIERLFDTGMLKAWVEADHREALEALEQRVDEAIDELASLTDKDSSVIEAWFEGDVEFDGTTGKRAVGNLGASVVQDQDDRFAWSFLGSPEDWLVLRDRASLAIQALGGTLDRMVDPESALHQGGSADTPPEIGPYPPETDVVLSVDIEGVQAGDVPCHVLFGDTDHRLRSMPRQLRDGSCGVHYGEGELTSFPSQTIEWNCLFLDPSNPVERGMRSPTVRRECRLQYPMARFKSTVGSSMAQGALMGLAAVAGLFLADVWRILLTSLGGIALAGSIVASFQNDNATALSFAKTACGMLLFLVSAWMLEAQGFPGEARPEWRSTLTLAVVGPTALLTMGWSLLREWFPGPGALAMIAALAVGWGSFPQKPFTPSVDDSTLAELSAAVAPEEIPSLSDQQREHLWNRRVGGARYLQLRDQLLEIVKAASNARPDRERDYWQTAAITCEEMGDYECADKAWTRVAEVSDELPADLAGELATFYAADVGAQDLGRADEFLNSSSVEEASYVREVARARALMRYERNGLTSAVSWLQRKKDEVDDTTETLFLEREINRLWAIANDSDRPLRPSRVVESLPHKAPPEWRDGPIPTGNLTRREKLMAMKFEAVNQFGDDNLSKALDTYDRAIELAQDRDLLVELKLGKGRVVESYKSNSDALEYYNGLYDNFSHYHRVPNRLAWFLATHSNATIRDGERALQLAREAANNSGWQNPSILDTLAQAIIQETGDYRRAIALLEDALELDPKREHYWRRLEQFSNQADN